MQAIPSHEIVRTGLALSRNTDTDFVPLVKFSDGDESTVFTVENSGAVWLQVLPGAANATITIETSLVVEGLAVEDRTVTVPTGSNNDGVRIGPFSRRIYGGVLRVRATWTGGGAAPRIAALTLGPA